MDHLRINIKNIDDDTLIYFISLSKKLTVDDKKLIIEKLKKYYPTLTCVTP